MSFIYTKRSHEFNSLVPTISDSLLAQAQDNELGEDNDAAFQAQFKAACEAIRAFGPRRREDARRDIDVPEFSVSSVRRYLVARAIV